MVLVFARIFDRNEGLPARQGGTWQKERHPVGLFARPGLERRRAAQLCRARPADLRLLDRRTERSARSDNSVLMRQFVLAKTLLEP